MRNSQTLVILTIFTNILQTLTQRAKSSELLNVVWLDHLKATGKGKKPKKT